MFHIIYNYPEKEKISIIHPDLTKRCNFGSKIDEEKNEVFKRTYRPIFIKLGIIFPFYKKCNYVFHNDIIFNLFLGFAKKFFFPIFNEKKTTRKTL